MKRNTSKIAFTVDAKDKKAPNIWDRPFHRLPRDYVNTNRVVCICGSYKRRIHSCSCWQKKIHSYPFSHKCSHWPRQKKEKICVTLDIVIKISLKKTQKVKRGGGHCTTPLILCSLWITRTTVVYPLQTNGLGAPPTGSHVPNMCSVEEKRWELTMSSFDMMKLAKRSKIITGLFSPLERICL